MEVEAFELGEYRGEFTGSHQPLDLRETLDRLVNPCATSETLHWGRNYLYTAVIETPTGAHEVAIKQFRNQTLKDRLNGRFKGSKAKRSWRAALALQSAGIATPAPVAVIESQRIDGPSFFAAERLHGFFEARYFFRALETEREQEEYPEINADQLIEVLGRSIRQLHDAGVWHRDLSIGNLLLRHSGDPEKPTEVFFVDLNRARVGRHMGTMRRTRDLCRLRIFRDDHQELFLRSYWGEEAAALGWKRFLYQLYFRGFLLKIQSKAAIRHPFRALNESVRPRRPHVHIPPAPQEASSRDRSVWDTLSDQPHQHATRFQRLLVRLSDAPLHAREMGAGLGGLARARRRYRELQTQLYSKPSPWQGMGIALRPWPQNPEALLSALEILGTRRALLRLHSWQQDQRHEEELASELHRRGFELTFVLAQDREMVRDLERWRTAVTELAERFGRFGHHFQIGQAINRSKWGVWNHQEYLDLVEIAAEVLRQRPRVEILGPAIIDYEFYRTAGILNIAHPGVHFDALASLLYVDRRGAPENRQLGFDTVDKVVQLKAIAETARYCGERSWITEVNWPLWEGPHSPAGRKVAVDQESQADYLVRYYLLTLATGMVERVYWWQLIARGYGLSHDDGSSGLNLRPSFHAFSTLYEQLEGATFLRPLAAPESQRLYHFRRGGEEAVVAWSDRDNATVAKLPRRASRVVGRDGEELPPPAGEEIEINGSPRYFWLETD